MIIRKSREASPPGTTTHEAPALVGHPLNEPLVLVYGYSREEYDYYATWDELDALKAEGARLEREDMIQAARVKLGETDFVVVKSSETTRKLSEAWKAWREEVRDIVRGDARPVPPEPERWASEIAAEPEVKPLGHPDEAPDLEAENEALRARAEAAEKRLAELEARDAPVGLPPNPAETKLSDYYIPAEIRDLMEEGETFPQARKRLSELLNVEKAELRLKRAAGSATEAELKREADVDRLQGLFSKLGEI